MEVMHRALHERGKNDFAGHVSSYPFHLKPEMGFAVTGVRAGWAGMNTLVIAYSLRS